MATHQIFFLLLLIFLPTQLGFHFWPDWAFVLGRRVDYLSPTLYLTDILIFLIVGSWLFQRSSKLPIRQAQGRQFKTQSFGYIALGILFAATNIFFAASRPVAVYKWIKALEFVGLGWYIIKTKPASSFVVWPLSFGIIYTSLLAIGQFVLQRSLGGPFWWLGERTFTADTPGIAQVPIRWDLGVRILDFGLKMRPYATFPHPNVLGGFLAATLPLIIVKLLNCYIVQKQFSNTAIKQFGNRHRWQVTYFALVALFGLIALVLSFSRSAWIVGGVAIALSIAKLKVQSVKFKVKTQISIIFLILVLVLGFWFLVQSVSPAEESVMVRQELNKAAVKLWQQSPIVGVGLGNFLVKLPEVLPSRQIYFLQPVHNIYLLLLSETGLVGLLLFGGLILFLIKNYELRFMNYGKDKKALFVIHNSLFIILLLGLVDHYPLTLQQGQLLLTILLAFVLKWRHVQAPSVR